MTDELSINVLQKKFTEIYKTNGFCGDESLSGIGSGSEQTKTILMRLPLLLKKYNISSLIDAPCGDMFWMIKVLQHNPLNLYVGVDIVPEMIHKNQDDFGSDNVSFICRDITQEPLPKGDLILCRDCLVHLSYADALNAIKNMKNSGSDYLLITHFIDRTTNTDLGADFWRPLNMQLAPFNFPEPIDLLVEDTTEEDGAYADKTLALWNLSDIQI